MSASENNPKKIWVIGKLSADFPSTKLPTTKCVLKTFFYNIFVEKKTVNGSANDVSTNLSNLWHGHGMPTVEKDKIVRKLKKLHQEYGLLKKSKSRKSPNQIAKIKNFKNKISELFDIAHSNFDALVQSVHVKTFLEDQRENRAMKFVYIEDEAGISQNRSHKKKSDITDYDTGIPIDDRDDDTDDDTDDDPDDDTDDEFTVQDMKRECIPRLGDTIDPSTLINKIIQSPIVTSAIDRINISAEQFRQVMAPIAVVAKAKTSNIRLSRSTIKRRRKRNREDIATTIKDNFVSQAKLSNFVVHWDGKLLADMTNKNYALKKHKVDRIAVAVSGNGSSKLLGIPRAYSGTGICMAQVVFDEVKKWNITKNVVAMCSDTTNSNTGHKNGVVALLESQFFKDDLIFFPCRHHQLEVILAGVFSELFGRSTGPNIQYFVDLQTNWSHIKKKSALNSLPAYNFNTPFKAALRTETIACLQSLLADNSSYIPRDDYRELIDLTLLILGVPNPTYVLKTPGALHHARWMAKIIYSFKLYLLRKQLSIANEFVETLEEFSLFCGLLYVKQWFTSPLLADAAFNDLMFYKNLTDYSDVNRQIARSALNKFNRHLSYLGPELTAFALFSNKVSVSEKRSMIAKMKKCDGHWKRNRDPTYKNLHLKELNELITSRSLFALHKIDSITFTFMLHNDPSVWETSVEFQQVEMCLANAVYSISINDTLTVCFS